MTREVPERNPAVRDPVERTRLLSLRKDPERVIVLLEGCRVALG